ncbi:hypothetical protein [Rhizobium herbae]|uniref:Uncharacterized protein n=1 Tax=Rhizobium herbae TaxID=508661 RepID=A0ABS4EGS5_9HYPH|nr:hypothetical protein [Rhizobium herbae]MBP1857149.1 hypothetical protein [Rhizobium herbae]
MPNPAPKRTPAEQRRDETLQRNTLEIIGIPLGCPYRACRRHRRCGFVTGADRTPACLAHLSPEARALHDRLLAAARTRFENLHDLVSAHVRATVARDLEGVAVSEIVRLAQPRGHWLHASLPFWRDFAHSAQALKRGDGKDGGNGNG